jgi:ABC-2 type transport system permease protein
MEERLSLWEKMTLWRVWPVVRKEFIQVIRDKRLLMLIFLQPILSLFLFGYALGVEVKNIPTAVWDQSRSPESRRLIGAFSSSGYFAFEYYAGSYQEMTALLDGGKVKAGLVIPPDYAEALHRGEAAQMQVMVDGSDPGVALPTLSYAALIATNYTTEIVAEALHGISFSLPVNLATRVLFNPDLDAVAFNVPGVMGIVLQWISLSLVALSIVGEKERGTMEQLIVTPIRALELMVGKMLPYLVISIGDMLIALAIAVWWFGMPMLGSVLLLTALSLVFLLFSLGLGLLISTIARNQEQAQVLQIPLLLPMLLLSGFMYPIEAMPAPAQAFANLLPLTHLLRIIRGIVLKGVGLEYLWRETLFLAVLGIVTMVLSAWRFQKRVG